MYTKSVVTWYDKITAYGRSLIILFFCFTALYAEATYVPPRYGVIGDEGHFLDEQSRIILQQMITEIKNKYGYTLFIVTEPKGACNSSEYDAQYILEAYTENKTEKSLLLYFCENESGQAYFQYSMGAGFSDELNEPFFNSLESTILMPYNKSYQLGLGMVVAVKLIEEVQFRNTKIDFEEVASSLKETPQNAGEISRSSGARFGKTDKEDLFLRGFVFCLFLTILGIGAVYAMRTKGIAAWLLFFFMIPFWLIFFTIVMEDYGWVMTVLYVVLFIGGRIMVANNNWWFSHRTVLRSSGAFIPPPAMIAEPRRRVSRRRFEGKGSGGSWEQDYE